MSKIMDCEGVLGLARGLLEENPVTCDSPDDFLLHLRDTYNLAGEAVDIGISNYPGLKRHLIREEVALAGGLHDIGRPLKSNQLFHELRGARFIEQNGLNLGIAYSLINVYRVAQMFRPHYVVAEQFSDPKNAKEREEFEPLDSDLLIPRTWQEAIIVYAELSNVRGERLSIQERIGDIRRRYADAPKSGSNASLINAMERGLDRVLAVCERVQKLKDGSLSEQEIARWGFL